MRLFIIFSLVQASIALNNCGKNPGDCEANNCKGWNDPPTGVATCSDGLYIGCPCKYTCGKYSSNCNLYGCDGVNNPATGVGYCTGGKYRGCDCVSVCTPDQTEFWNCNDSRCNGINQPHGLLGLCKSSTARNCPCASVCAQHDRSCDSDGCNGVDGFCTAGQYIGCSCGSPCGNTEIGPCNGKGCNGVSDPSNPFGPFGVCTSSSLDGCACTNVWGDRTGPCNNSRTICVSLGSVYMTLQ